MLFEPLRHSRIWSHEPEDYRVVINYFKVHDSPGTYFCVAISMGNRCFIIFIVSRVNKSRAYYYNLLLLLNNRIYFNSFLSFNIILLYSIFVSVKFTILLFTVMVLNVLAYYASFRF